MAINGEAEDVGADAVRTVALAQDVKPRCLAAIVSEVIDAVGGFEEFAERYDVRHTLDAGIKRIGPLAS